MAKAGKTIGECLELTDDKVAVRRFARRTESSGGIALADRSQEEPRFGRVIAVGPGRPLAAPLPDGLSANPLYFPMTCKVGDVVILPPVVDSVEMVDGDKDSRLCFCAEGNLVAIIKDAGFAGN